ncbi:translation initiation factor 2A [Cryptococcus neoformans C23]|uniref:Eukaryotic translation initiation factor 2A n=1 Tax=Cryptococcus neoformans (strain H99 / ATCC 208821 / CBS 10515 / FGSC 9487) TaxID=235443 RepID=J9VWD6_CRYN9|nr:translation initiation factor 2A [Cryptococcus neoformans var. grubii H99]AFR98792.1 translation initiation factor 2A [Cryptococcus neoformans var. grubii H99]AUB28988.1 translation initiation factor 2A [Cryptococcus neoformans var. grubii]OWZ38363.1 translation initiation factor 2A [Cryptococcus neoformans var. grubii C23]|eukprot:XP_012053715.1 translation initiation factor 2A [Cryptococcus neoformans var. grubii H99]
MVGTQYAFRAQKTAGVADAPAWEVSNRIPAETVGSKCYAYSPNGEWLAYAMNNCVKIIPSHSSSPAPVTLQQANIVALKFSPMSSYLFTFERPVKTESGEMYKNAKAWDVKNGEIVGGWYQKTMEDWEPIITPNETHLLRAGPSDLAIFSPPFAPRPSTRLKIEGIRGIFISDPSALPATSTNSRPISAHPEPAVAIWIGEKKGAPASLGLWSLSSLMGKNALQANGNGDIQTETRDMPPTTARKAFYKADKLTVKWNNAGTMALFLAQSDVDNSGKSYYGETNLYLVGLDGTFDGLVELDKEGPIYDFAWSPISREFTVCYGYMPARTQMFDLKAKPVYSFGENPRNTLVYQPQGKLLLSAGFGNLAGGIDIWDVSTRNKIAEFKASNASHCEWSPCGRYVLTATLSPRLRVDNGVKVWWCNGQLLHIQPVEELYQASFAPQRVTDIGSFPAVVPKAPEANPSVATYRPKGETDGAATKSAGAYRPPGARNRPEGENVSASFGSSRGKPGVRTVPGAGGRQPPGSAPGASAGAGGDDKKKRQRKRGGKDKEEEKKDEAPTQEAVKAELKEEAGEDAVAKKIRNLMKKLKAIDELKTKLAAGEVLEKTQLKKIESEAQVKSEIKALGGNV